MTKSQNRFDEVWTDAMAAEAAALELQQVERSYRRVLAMTDDVLGKLEERNLHGQRRLDDMLRCDIARTLTELPLEAQRRYRQAETVQGALDGIFLVQEPLLLVLQRLLHWDRLLTATLEEETTLAQRTA